MAQTNWATVGREGGMFKAVLAVSIVGLAMFLIGYRTGGLDGYTDGFADGIDAGRHQALAMAAEVYRQEVIDGHCKDVSI